ncbi:MAG: DUF559 domain-containing protein [Cytophagales bacterium]|nr:DUF559 domain-containing protein [Cytophagales bacterium]
MSRFSNNHYNKSLKEFARKLRKDGTKSEAMVSRDVLSRKQMMGYRFLRQRPIDRYIADFFSKELKLIIELDGYIHQFEEMARKDQIMEERLGSLGYHILLSEDEEVFKDLKNVVRTIENWILDWEEKNKS